MEMPEFTTILRKLDNSGCIPAECDPVERLLDVTEIAQRLSISPDSVWKMARDGRFIAPLRVGSMPRWRVKDFNAWIEQRAAAVAEIEAAAQRAARPRRRRYGAG